MPRYSLDLLSWTLVQAFNDGPGVVSIVLTII